MRIETILKSLLFIALGLFLGSRLLNGTLSFYIHPRFNVLTGITAVTLILTGAAYGWRQWLDSRRQHAGHEHDHTHSHDHDHDHGHDHDHDHTISWVGLLLLAMPVLLGLLVAPRPLGANALANREINVGAISSAQAPQSQELTVIPSGGERNILDWLYLFQRTGDLSELNGTEASVIGFVYRDARFESEEFMVSRFTVACCVADAAPIGLVVRWPDAPQLADDTWVEVSGAFQLDEFEGQPVMVLVAADVSPTTPPSQPYLYE